MWREKLEKFGLHNGSFATILRHLGCGGLYKIKK